MRAGNNGLVYASFVVLYFVVPIIAEKNVDERTMR